MNLDLQGLDQLMAKLEKMNTNVNKVQNQALREAAKPVLESQKQNVPKDTHKLEKGLKIGRISTKQGVKTITIGIHGKDNPDLFYGKFQNWGYTVKSKKGVKVIPGKFFIERSKEENKDEVINIMKATIKEGIDNAKR